MTPEPLVISVSAQVTAPGACWEEPESYLVSGIVWLPDDPTEDPWVAILDTGDPYLDVESLIDRLGAQTIADRLLEASVERADHQGLLCHGCGHQSQRCDCGDTCPGCGARGPWDRMRPPPGARGCGGWRCRECGRLDDELARADDAWSSRGERTW